MGARSRGLLQQPQKQLLRRWASSLPCSFIGDCSMGTDQPAQIVRGPSDEEARAAFDAYTCALGKVAHAWNYLHERLGSLFASLVNAPDRSVIAAVWHSSYSDRAQRQMLVAVIANINDQRWQSFPKNAKNNLISVLTEIDKLGSRRDDAVHAPSILMTDVGGSMMAAHPLSGNRRAQHLSGKHLIKEFGKIENYIENYSRYIMSVEQAWLYSPQLWPDTPENPSQKHQKTGRHPASHAKGPQ